jgi:hypothetical protein
MTDLNPYEFNFKEAEIPAIPDPMIRIFFDIKRAF